MVLGFESLPDIFYTVRVPLHYYGHLACMVSSDDRSIMVLCVWIIMSLLGLIIKCCTKKSFSFAISTEYRMLLLKCQKIVYLIIIYFSNHCLNLNIS